MSRDLIQRGLGWSWTPLRVQRSIADAETNVAIATLRDSAVAFDIMKYQVDAAAGPTCRSLWRTSSTPAWSAPSVAHGFLRLRCGHDKRVAFSCKRRGFCPPCGARRMAQTAAHRVDHVILHVAVRQWVRSCPAAVTKKNV